MDKTLRLALLTSASLYIFSSGSALAQTATPSSNRTPLDDITVTATRQEEKVIDALSSTSVTSRQELQTQAPQRLGTAISQMPGVSTQENPNDPATAINIRGLQDFGRVAVTVDSARQNFQRSGHNANGAFFLDPAFIKSIDVTNGPVSNVYGSGAIGGVVSIETVDPWDILRPKETIAGEIGFTGVAGGRQTGLYGHGIGAFRANEYVSGLLGFSSRKSDAYQPGGGGAYVADSGQEMVSGIGKVVLTPGDGHTLKLSGQLQKYDFTNGTGTSTSIRRANDVYTSNFVAKYSFSRPDIDWLNLNASIYNTTTFTDQVRLSGTAAQIGNGRYFGISTTGADINNTSRFALGPTTMAITYGVDYFQDQVRTFDPFSNGDETTPSGSRTAYGTFIQNHIKWSMFDVIGGLRFDGYALNGGGNSSAGQRVSPKITVGVTPVAGIQPYVTYAEGYRAPSVTETLVSGLHPSPTTFLFIPNPNLRAETGHTLEAGVNVKYDDSFKKGDKFRAKFSVFQNNVLNYIDGVYVDPGNNCGIVATGCNDARYTYQNVLNARLQGVEGQASYDARNWFVGVSGSIVRGDNLITNQPLESVYPDKLAFSGGIRFLDDKLTLGGRLTFVAEQTRLPSTAALTAATPGYTLVDLSLTYEMDKGRRIFVTAENIGDVRYRRYRDGDLSPGLTTKFGFTTRFGT